MSLGSQEDKATVFTLGVVLAWFIEDNIESAQLICMLRRLYNQSCTIIRAVPHKLTQPCGGKNSFHNGLTQLPKGRDVNECR